MHSDLDFTSDPWPGISESAKDLVKKMLVRDPSKRLSAFDVLRKFLICYLIEINISETKVMRQHSVKFSRISNISYS